LHKIGSARSIAVFSLALRLCLRDGHNAA